MDNLTDVLIRDSYEMLKMIDALKAERLRLAIDLVKTMGIETHVMRENLVLSKEVARLCALLAEVRRLNSHPTAPDSASIEQWATMYEIEHLIAQELGG